MPRGAAPQLLLGVLALLVALALAVVPVVDARPKDRKDGKKDEVAAETVPSAEPAQPDAAAAEPLPVIEQPLTATEGEASNDRSLIQSDADGDYIPDALDNCPSAQNPEQADADGDGHGDACPVYQDTDGDSVPDQQDNCPTVGTSDFSDRDGDGVGDPCDKSPDGIEPEPEPVPAFDGQGGEGDAAAPEPVNGEGVDGKEVERDGRSRSRERSRTSNSRPQITTGAEGAQEGIGGPPAQSEPVADEPVRDNPRRNEELIAAAAASGELYAPPEPPPVAQRAWDEEAAGAVAWDSVVRIDAGAADDASPGSRDGGDQEPNDAERRTGRGGDGGDARAARDGSVGDSGFARGWVRAKLVLQDEALGETGDGDVAEPVPGRGETAPVPVENGLVINGAQGNEGAQEQPSDAEDGADDEPLDEPAAADDREPDANPADRARGRQPANPRDAARDGSRRNGSSRSAAAAERPRPAADASSRDDASQEPRQRRQRREKGDGGNRGRPSGWSEDRYYSGGSALNWSDDIDVAGTDDDGLYVTQRSGSGPGKRRGFEYAIPLAGDGVYQVRLYFAEPYWGAPGGPDGEEGRRVFSVTGEGEALFEELDVYAEVGAVTALVKQTELEVTDGELNLRFVASEGEPIVAAIEVLEPAG